MSLGIWKIRKKCPFSKQHKQKLSKSHLGKKHTEESKKKLSENHANVSGQNNPMFGKKHSKETKEKISKASKGHVSWNKGLKMPERSGNKNPGWRGGKPNCINCNKILSSYGYKRCRNCHDKWVKIPKNNPRWRGGISFKPYSSEFTEQLKKEVRQRDNHTCQKCFKTQEEELQEYNRKLSIHHIDYNKKNCEKTNLITLCLVCNIKANKSRVYWTDYFVNLIDLLDWT